jgi:hypothetical protein
VRGVAKGGTLLADTAIMGTGTRLLSPMAVDVDGSKDTVQDGRFSGLSTREAQHTTGRAWSYEAEETLGRVPIWKRSILTLPKELSPPD